MYPARQDTIVAPYLPPRPSGLVPACAIMPELSGLPSITGEVENERRLIMANAGVGTGRSRAYCQDLLNIWIPLLGADKYFENLRGQILVDPGAGVEGYGLKLAQMFGARAYIAVEPFHFRVLSHYVARDSASGSSSIPAAVIASDALTVLRALPDHSVSVLASGLDSAVLKADYQLKMTDEIVRVVAEDGIYAAYNSELHPQPGVLEILFEPQTGFRWHGLTVYSGRSGLVTSPGAP